MLNQFFIVDKYVIKIITQLYIILTEKVLPESVLIFRITNWLTGLLGRIYCKTKCFVPLRDLQLFLLNF